ncbi:MAG: hypothetical protein ACREFD_08655 [Stellaceae bacterium]
MSTDLLAKERGAASGFAQPVLPGGQAPSGTVLWDELTPTPAPSQLTNEINTGPERGR